MTLGALMIITMISIGQQRSAYMVIEDMYVREQESAAFDYASMRLEDIVNRLAYDEAMSDGSEPDVSTLSASTSFGPDTGETKEEDYDDIDDYHGFTESVQHALSADTFRFEVTYSVRYVNPASPSLPTAAATFAKELTVDVVSRDTIGYKVAKYEGNRITIATENS